MPIKYMNGRPAKENDPVVGLDWRGGVVEGTAVKGDTKKGHPELVFMHSVFKTVCPSLSLSGFAFKEDAAVNTDGIHSVTAKDYVEPAVPTGTA